MTKIVIESAEQYDELLSENEEVLLVLTAPSWCVPCKRLAPHLDSVAVYYSHPIAYVDIDIPANQELYERYEVQSVPTLIQVRKDSNRRIAGLTAMQILKYINVEDTGS